MTESEMQKMQQEAIRRAQEMHRRASRFNTDSEPAKDAAIPVTENISSPSVSSAGVQEPSGVNAGKADTAFAGGIFDMLFRDKEKTLILGIILLLMDEKTDNSLLLALIYLLI